MSVDRVVCGSTTCFSLMLMIVVFLIVIMMIILSLLLLRSDVIAMCLVSISQERGSTVGLW